jgi:transposase
MPGKKYSDDFKKEAVRLLESTGRPKTTIEKELGITHGLLGRWQKRFQINPVTDGLELSEVEQLKAELRAMKRELDITRMERDILNKTVGIFSKDVRP